MEKVQCLNCNKLMIVDEIKKGTDVVCKNLDKNGTSITITCKMIETTTPPTINQLFLIGTLNADLCSLLQLNITINLINKYK